MGKRCFFRKSRTETTDMGTGWRPGVRYGGIPGRDRYGCRRDMILSKMRPRFGEIKETPFTQHEAAIGLLQFTIHDRVRRSFSVGGFTTVSAQALA